MHSFVLIIVMLMVKLRAIRMCSEEEYDDYLQKYSLKCGGTWVNKQTNKRVC